MKTITDKDKMLQCFSKKLKELMKENKKSSLHLEKDLKISNSAISHWINAAREPKLGYLWILAEYFGVSIDELVGKTEY